MVDRPHAFGEQKYSILDNLIFSLRKRQVVKHLPRLNSQSIADLGSGFDARLLIGLLNKNKNITGIAFDMAFSDSLSVIDNLELVTGDLNNPLNKATDSVDLCITLAVLEHLDKPQEFLNEIFRILKPGGRVVLTTPGPSSKPLLEFLALKLKVIDSDEILDHKNYFSSADLKNMFIKAGFSSNNINTKTFIFGMNNLVVATN